jgi:serine protease AprX
MRIPVITVLPSQEPLQRSAAAGMSRRGPTDLSKVSKPNGLVLDPNFNAVALGSGSVGQSPSASTHAPDKSATFAVRGFVEADSADAIPADVDGQPIFADPKISPFLTCGGTPPVGSHTDVAAKLNVAGLAARGMDGDGVAIAILDTGINLKHLNAKRGAGNEPLFDAGNSWTPPNSTNAAGAYPVNHGTMCAFDALIAAPKATLLDFPILANPAPGGSAAAQTLSVALLGFAQLLAFWAVAFAPGGGPKYRALVVSNSWGVFHPSWDFPAGHPGRFIDNPNHPFNILVKTLASSGADIVFAAGNCGAQCADGRCQGNTKQTIVGGSALQEVLTLAGCDINDARVGYSSQGPSIAGMFQQKPDITAYTHFSGSEAFGAGSPDSGTSAACPVASGCVAALRTKISRVKVPPASLFASLRSSARQVPGQNGWNGDYGFGIIDPLAVATAAGV